MKSFSGTMSEILNIKSINTHPYKKLSVLVTCTHTNNHKKIWDKKQTNKTKQKTHSVVLQSPCTSLLFYFLDVNGNKNKGSINEWKHMCESVNRQIQN